MPSSRRGRERNREHGDWGTKRRAGWRLTSVRQEIANTRVEMLKWSFLFWLGQVATMAALMAFMLRSLRP
jgi:hypothetical protein